MRTDTLTRNEREQKIALCSKTWLNLYGHLPSIAELCECLGMDYYSEIVLYAKQVSSICAA